MLESIADFFIDLIDKTGYIGIFLATTFESFFAPIPSEIVLVTAGLYAQEQGGLEKLALVVIAASFGNYFGTMPFYLIARYGADSFLPKFIKNWGPYLLISQNDLDKSQRLFEKWGSVIVFIARLIPGIRSFIAFPAGAAKMSFLKYTFFTFLGSSLWNLFLASIGFFAYDKKDEFFKLVDPVENVILGILALGILFYCYKVYKQFRAIKKEAQHSTD